MKRIFILLTAISLWLTPALAQDARTPLQAVQFIKLANTLREVDKSQESISLLMRAMPAVESKNPYWEAVANEFLGLSYKDLKDTTNALRYLERARTQYTKLKYVASGWGVNEIMRSISGKDVYAGIQIGPSVITVAIFKTKYETDFYDKDVRTTFTIPNDPQFVADASNTFKAGQDALRIGLDSIRRYNIPNERIFIVFNSDLDEELARAPEKRQALYRQLVRVLPNATLRIDTTLTSAREAELFTIGTIPRKVWPTTSALNVGATSTMGGYFDRDASRRNYTNATKSFHKISLPIGVSTLVNRIESKRTLSMDAYRREAQRVVQTLADSVAAQLGGTDAGLRDRRTVGIGGEIVLALVTYLYPERAGITAVPISTADVEKFKRLALTDYKALTRPDLSSITDLSVRTTAEKDMATIQSQLTEKQLIAGSLWLDALMKQYNAASSPKRFVFVRNAGIGWVTGKFLETINYEYESTIAKGAMYTR